MRSAVALTRSTFGLPWPATFYGAWLVLRANQLWAPFPDNDPDGARRAMERFYVSSSAGTRSSIRPWQRGSRFSGGACTASISTTASPAMRAG